MMAEVRGAMSARDYPKALALLTKLQRQPEFPERAHAQELLGLARERSGQLAHAKAEYEEYLRRYPQGEAAERVAFRLRILRAAEAKARTGRAGEGDTSGWEVVGGLAQTLRYDGSRVTNGAPPPNTQLPPAAQSDTENALFTDVDLLARHRGETYDWVGRLSAGYDKAFGQESSTLGSATRVSLASVEMVDRPLGLADPPRPPGGQPGRHPRHLRRAVCVVAVQALLGGERRGRLPGGAAEPGAADGRALRHPGAGVHPAECALGRQRLRRGAAHREPARPRGGGRRGPLPVRPRHRRERHRL